MMGTERVKDLLELPEAVGKRDFVVALSEGLQNPARTVDSYVVTPALRDAFDQALTLVGTALEQGRSRAAYLHGSFGSGKSHFMALLSLMLQGSDVVWAKPELHALRDKHAFVGKKRFLELHFHMVGHTSLEEAIFTRYVDHVRREHPEAPIPALYGDEKLFDDARRMMDQMGEAAFFAPLEEDTPKVGWGSMATTWSRARFDELAQHDDPDERAKLFSALVKTWFSSYAEGSRAFIDLDAGLARMASHAKAMGYDAIVFFLDELILWLAARASDAAWLNTELQKMVKLVEAQDAHREVPLISYIARQRDLTQLVGEDWAGIENVRLRDALDWWEGRYDTVKLEDRNLPAIVEKRVRRPKDAAAEAALKQGFEQLKRAADGPTWDIMLGHLTNEDFAKLYPFSPALVETLVDLSGSLQRQRTAIRLLMEMCVEHIEDLDPGEVVGVGDVFDLLASGEDSTDGVMKARFEAAKQLYKHGLLPVIREKHGTETPERCQRMRNDHPVKLGCSNCEENACRSDNQLIKTLVMAALVPETAPLKDLTIRRLVALNHGALKVPIPGTEASLAAQRLRDYAARVGQLRVGEGADPAVRLIIEGVDLGPILQQAATYDNEAARQRVLRDLLFDAMGIESITETGRDADLEWRSTKRVGHIRFGNVRTMTPEQLRCPEDHDWRLVVDYPFDAQGHGPHEDEQVVEAFLEAQPASWTLVWLPSFFSKAMNDLLGELTILEHILSGGQLRQYVQHLTVENQGRAKLDLENLRSQKRARLQKALEEAYGLAKAREGDLDPAQSVEKHLRVLAEGAPVHPSLAANLHDAWKRYVEALLEARYPRHPRLAVKLTGARLDRLVERFGDIVDREEKWVAADRDEHKEMAGSLAQLGLVDTPEGRVRLVADRTLQQLDNKRRAQNVERPTVSQLAHWLDERGQMGLTWQARDVVVRCYARWDKRSLVHHGRAYEPVRNKPLPDDVELEKPDLPEQAAWAKALDLAGTLLGVALAGRALHADNLKRFQTQLDAALERVGGAAQRRVELLERRAAELGVEADAPRTATARSAKALVDALLGQPAPRQVEVLAGFEAHTSPSALNRSLQAARANETLLGEDLVFGVFEQLRARADTLPGAAERLEAAASTLRQDELNRALVEHLKAEAKRGQALLKGDPVIEPDTAGETTLHTVRAATGKAAVVAALRDALAAAEGASEAVALVGSLRVTDES